MHLSPADDDDDPGWQRQHSLGLFLINESECEAAASSPFPAGLSYHSTRVVQPIRTSSVYGG